MTLFDYAVLAIVGFSVLLSVIRGLIRELLAVAAWVAAFVVATLFGGTLAPYLPEAIPGEPLRAMAAYMMLFIVTLIAGSLVALAVSKLVKTAGLSVEDRVLGAAFGLVRGMAVVVVLMLIAGLTAMPRQAFWMDAMLSGPLEALALNLKALLPQDWSQQIRYD
jgi:membrane protein required for colicin V production